MKTDRSELDKTIELANEQGTFSRLTIALSDIVLFSQSVIGETCRI